MADGRLSGGWWVVGRLEICEMEKVIIQYGKVPIAILKDLHVKIEV